MDKFGKYFFRQSLFLLLIFCIFLGTINEDGNTISLMFLIGLLLLCIYTVSILFITWLSSYFLKNNFIAFVCTPIILLLFGLIFNGRVMDAFSFEGNNKYLISGISLSANVITYYLVKKKLQVPKI